MALLGLENRPTERVLLEGEDTEPVGEISRTVRGRLALALWLAPVVALVLALYSASVHVVAGTADGATVLLEGSSLEHGELTLHGWALSLDSFWAIEAVFYAIAIRIAGIRLELLHLVPALLATLVIVTGILLARDGRRGFSALIAGVVVFALLGLPSPDLAYYLLQGPWHVGTTLYCLIAFACIATGRRGWPWWLGVVLLAAGLVSDLLILDFGVLPVFLSGIVVALRSRRLRSGVPAVAAALASVALSILIEFVGHAFGSFTLVNRNIVVRLPRVEANVIHIGNRIPELFGVNSIPIGPYSNGARVAQMFHVVALVLVLGAVLLATARLLRGVIRPGDVSKADHQSWRLDDLLLIGILADLVLFVWGSPSGNFEYGKYLLPAVIFASVLCGRTIGRLTERVRTVRATALVATAMLVLVGVFGAEFLVGLGGRAPQTESQPLDSFLVAHHLSSGIGDYWSSSLVTVGTGGQVAVRPVEVGAGGRLERFSRQSQNAWYVGKRFNFFVYDSGSLWHGVDASSAIATYGKPAHVYELNTYRILVWSHPFSVTVPAADYGNPLQLSWSLPPQLPGRKTSPGAT